MTHAKGVFAYLAYVSGGLALFAGLQTLMPALWASSLTLLIGVLVAFLLEKFFVYRAHWARDQGDSRRDFVATLLIFPVVVQLAQITGLGLRGLFAGAWLSSFSVLTQVLVGLLLGEFFFYWFHRLSHEKKWLWFFHRHHHVVSRVYWMNAGTFHVVDLYLNFVLYLTPLLLLGGSLEALQWLLLFSALTGLLEHANIRIEAGPLNLIFNTAELHRWHHSLIQTESKSNYGKALVLWDQVFGTYFHPQAREVGLVGIKDESYKDTNTAPVKASPAPRSFKLVTGRSKIHFSAMTPKMICEPTSKTKVRLGPRILRATGIPNTIRNPQSPGMK